MRELTLETVADYLRTAGRVPRGCAVTARGLGWGISNVVMRVEIEGGAPFVLKQSRERLRTEAHWVSRLDRIWTETAALRILGDVLPAGAVPAVLFEEPEDFLFAMTCAPDGSTVWKERLLAGAADVAVARRAGEQLGAIHAESPGHPGLAGPLADTGAFDELRIDPFYRAVAQVHPDLGPRLGGLIDSLLDPPEVTFVHGDYSPKNLLVHPAGLTAVDFETAHAGDPAFDLGFLLSHLLLKAFRATETGGQGPYLALIAACRDAYVLRAGIGPQADRLDRAGSHAAACALARLDGKGPVDYLDGPTREHVRRFARQALRDGAGWDALIESAAREMHLSLRPGP